MQMSEKIHLSNLPMFGDFYVRGILINNDVGLSYHGNRCLVLQRRHDVTALQP